jgi:DNA-binding NarL/FixJ family response regulator
MTEITKPKVLYVEDAVQSYDAVRMYLEAQGYEVLPMASSIEQARKIIQSDSPNIVLVDLKLPEEANDLSRLAKFAVELKVAHPELTVIVHSAYDKIRIDVARVLLSAGISYLIKEAVQSSQHLDRAIKHALTGGVVYDRHLVRFMEQVIGATSNSLLTEREAQVVALVADGLRNKEIAEELGISAARVNELVSSVLAKLHLSGRTQLVKWYLNQKSGHSD